MTDLFLKKYQPTLFDHFLDNVSSNDSSMIHILKTLVQINQLNILFIGKPISGKTTYIQVILNEYYGTAAAIYKSVLQINSLKEQGIQYFRNDVKTFCQTPSSIPGKKKTIVLDDIDTMNEQNQQIFRTHMDNYGHNVNFIVSCTNCQKVIESLQSRLSILNILPLSVQHLEQLADKIIQSESIEITQEAKQFILNLCGYNAKTLMNYLEKCKLIQQPIDFTVATNICTNINFTMFEQYIQLLRNNELSSAIQFIYNIYDKGFSVMDVLDHFFLSRNPVRFCRTKRNFV